MKKTSVILSVAFIIALFTACQSNNQPEVVPNNDMTENNTINDETDMENNEGNSNGQESTRTENTGDSTEAKDQDDMKEMMQQINFNKIEIEISYDNDQEYEAEIEHHSNGDIEADVEDEINGIDIDNDLEAFNHLFPLVKQLDVEQSTDKQHVIDQVLEIFELDNNYRKFEVEITFEDNVKTEFKDRK